MAASPRGDSGNPGERRRGSKNRATLAAQSLIDAAAEVLTRKAVELALAGDPLALRLCLGRVVAPRRDRVVEFPLPQLRTAKDLAHAMIAVADAAATGAITPHEGFELAQMVDTAVRAIEAGDFNRRLRRVEQDCGGQ